MSQQTAATCKEGKNKGLLFALFAVNYAKVKEGVRELAVERGFFTT
jgi:hypothetical protein